MESDELEFNLFSLIVVFVEFDDREWPDCCLDFVVSGC